MSVWCYPSVVGYCLSHGGIFSFEYLGRAIFFGFDGEPLIVCELELSFGNRISTTSAALPGDLGDIDGPQTVSLVKPAGLLGNTEWPGMVSLLICGFSCTPNWGGPAKSKGIIQVNIKVLHTMNPVMIFHLGVKSFIEHQCSFGLITDWCSAAWFSKIRIKIETFADHFAAASINNSVKFISRWMNWWNIILTITSTEYLVRITNRILLRRMICSLL